MQDIYEEHFADAFIQTSCLIVTTSLKTMYLAASSKRQIYERVSRQHTSLHKHHVTVTHIKTKNYLLQRLTYTWWWVLLAVSQWQTWAIWPPSPRQR